MLVDIDHVPFKVRCPNLRPECYTPEGDFNADYTFPNGTKTAELYQFFQLPPRLAMGIYEGNVNLHVVIDGIHDERNESFGFLFDSVPGVPSIQEDLDRLKAVCGYGVADNVPQVLKKLSPFVNHPTRTFVLSIVWNRQQDGDDFRWHKWGPYIGKKKPKCEHFKDEKRIREVCFYHLYEVKLP